MRVTETCETDGDCVRSVAFNKPSITKGKSENHHKSVMKEMCTHPMPLRQTTRAHYCTPWLPVNADPSPDRQPQEWESNGIRVRENQVVHFVGGYRVPADELWYRGWIVRLQVTSENMGMVRFASRHDCKDYASSQQVGERFSPATCELSTPRDGISRHQKPARNTDCDICRSVRLQWLRERNADELQVESLRLRETWRF